MTKLGAVFWLGLVLASGFTTFKVKYAVQNIDDQLTRVRKQTVAEQQEIRVLTAEWTYLNQPERLADLNRRFLQLGPITPKQLQQRIEDIPLRPPAPDVVAALSSAPPAAPQPTAASDTAPPAPAAALSPPANTSPPPAAVAAAAPAPAPAPALAATEAPPAPPVQLAKAEPVDRPRSLDALFAQIAARP